MLRASQLRHQSDSRYCFVLGDGRLFLRLGIAKEVAVSRVEVTFGPPQSFAKNHDNIVMKLGCIDNDFAYYETVLEALPCRFYYIFRIYSDGICYTYNETGVSEGYPYHLAFLSAFQMIAENRADYMLPKPSWEGRMFYQIFPERFACRGDPKKKAYVNRDWKSLDLHTTLRGNPFLGGDLYGVIDHLDYLSSLGVGAIYLNPIHPSPSNHKYDVLDYFDVEPKFGGKEALRELIEQAHERDIKIVLDMVFNHTSVFHPFFQDVADKGKASPYHEFYFIHGDRPDIRKKNYETFANAKQMPKLDTSNPKVQDYVIEVASYYMKEFGVDGFRLDVCEGVSHECWTRLKMALKKINPEVLLLGEIWLNSESYLGPNQIDGVMNYPLLGAISNYILDHKGAKEMAEELNGLIVRYKWGNITLMMNLLSSHDIQRVYRLASGNHDDILMAYAILFAFPGMPCVYYGDEIFMDGGGDPDCRRGMEWDSAEFKGEDHALFKALGQFHRSSSALRTGEVRIYEQKGLLFIERKSKDETLVLAVNRTPLPIELGKKAELSRHYDGKKLAPKGFAFYKEAA